MTETESMPAYRILDIIQLERERVFQRTENKNCVVISCRLSGESSFFYNDEAHIVKRGQVLYIPAGASYAQACEAEQVICFHLSVSGKVSFDIGVLQTEDPDKICALFSQAYNIWKRKEANYAYRCMAILYEIIALSGASIRSSASQVHPLLKPAVEYLQEHLYEESLSLEQVFEKSHISRTYFNRLFYDAYGCTPVAYINRRRMERAKQFLINGTYTNAEIARLCGYGNVKYFYVVFKKATGLTTKQYKNNAQP